MSNRSRRRPWLAALLALVVSGLGHAYLRRWARAFGWYVVITATVVFIVPDAAVDQLFAGERPPLSDIAPVLFIVAASVVDAYAIAVRTNREYDRQAAGAGRTSPPPNGGPDRAATSGIEESTPTCPDCGRDVDPGLDFCQWCAAPLDDERSND
ncbi:hypothetical protein C461_03397 [Halorubrum aidingense JCM 13560]|uniref:DUF7575 domain-containing protein n=1 Tax=Halorubrum aidingense JCM 13560 TaxID=1230454 RepID=M0PEU1_9EURY|nr:zinc ribbon domain-containing protein [Halorubrum aidingense]EMA68642.1 hypothetical protein C461_03397 [Halorubrum aidingense JCM 13560]